MIDREQEEEVAVVKCACNRCTVMIDKSDYTFPECPQCYANLDGRCA